MQPFVHYFLHLGFPLFIALALFRPAWRKAYLILLATMLVDADHLLATPVFEADRCSIGFHPLHSYPAAAVYFLLLFGHRPLNIVGVGLMFHLFTDLIDCLFTYHRCRACLAGAPAEELLRTVANVLNF